jgi:hypothetical protein
MTTTTPATMARDNTIKARMDTTMSRVFRSPSQSQRSETNSKSGGTTTPTPTIHTNKKADITKARNMAANTKMNTTMTNITTKEHLLPVSNRMASAGGIQKRIPRPSVISP